MPQAQHKIALPFLSPSDSTQWSHFSHILRDGGFRLEQQDINNKHIFHNYGQGSAQVSLSYGTAYLISKIITVRQDATKIKEVGVMGMGVNAIMTSLQLLKRGYKVTLYTKEMPVKKTTNGEKIVGVQEGFQIWYAGGYDNCDPLKHQLVAKHSFQFFKQCLLSNRYQSLRWVNCYCVGPKIEQLRQNVTDYINNQINPVELSFGNEKFQQYTCYKTILINSKLFIEQVYTELKLRNITFVQKQFKTLEDVMNLKQQCIFNCLGMQNKQIFGDSNLQQVKGCYYSIKNQKRSSPQILSLWISSQIQGQQDFTISIINNKMQINIKNIPQSQSQSQSQPGNNEQPKLKQISQKILTRAYHYIKQRTIKPYKL